MAMQEERCIPRYRVNCPAAFVVEGAAGTGKVFNLSEKGCGIESSTPVPDEGCASLSITLPDQAEPVVVELACVRWVTRAEFGLEFRILSRPARRRLQRFLLIEQVA
ncbi:MAG: PilZ domain-containing protein [Nitrospirae bacterium]|nr:PilZ domain-containing protein [Nitrospirota bacterium]